MEKEDDAYAKSEVKQSQRGGKRNKYGREKVMYKVNKGLKEY